MSTSRTHNIDGMVDDAIVDGEVARAPSQNAVFDGLALKADLTYVNAQDVALAAYADAAADNVIAVAITNGDTTHAPNGDVVFDALAAKQPASAALTDLAGAPGTYNVPLTSGLGQYVFKAINADTFLGFKTGDLAPGPKAMSPDEFDFVAAADYAAMRVALGFDAAAQTAVIASSIVDGDLHHAGGRRPRYPTAGERRLRAACERHVRTWFRDFCRDARRQLPRTHFRPAADEKQLINNPNA